MLCKNRPEGFGASSSHSSLPTTCFTDTILLPLPTWLLLIALAILTSLALSRSRSQRRLQETDNLSQETLRPTQRWHIFGSRDGRIRPYTYKILLGFYYLFVAASVLLAVLEIARLATIDFGIALLPFPIIGIVVAGGVHLTHGVNNKISYWQIVNMLFWALNMVFSVVKTVGLVMEEGVEGRKGSMYPVADQVTDTGVMAGLFLLLVAIEGGLWVWKGRLGRDIRVDKERMSVGSMRLV